METYGVVKQSGVKRVGEQQGAKCGISNEYGDFRDPKPIGKQQESQANGGAFRTAKPMGGIQNCQTHREHSALPKPGGAIPTDKPIGCIPTSKTHDVHSEPPSQVSVILCLNLMCRMYQTHNPNL